MVYNKRIDNLKLSLTVNIYLLQYKNFKFCAKKNGKYTLYSPLIFL